jgi:hypothetical protein
MISLCLHSRFWWPHIIEDIKWYAKTCHECRVQQTCKLHIPPTVPIPGGLLRQVDLSTLYKRTACLHHTWNDTCCARRTLTRYAPLFSRNSCAHGDQSLLTHKSHLIILKPMGIVKRRHHNVHEAIIKTCEGDKTCWNQVVHSVFWAERITVQKVMGLSPYFMMHGVKPNFPFDLAKAIFLTPLKRRGALTTTKLIAWRMRQLQKCTEDLEAIRERVVATCFRSICKFQKCFHKKMKPCYLGPMVVVHHTKGGSYMLAELDGAISKL